MPTLPNTSNIIVLTTKVCDLIFKDILHIFLCIILLLVYGERFTNQSVIFHLLTWYKGEIFDIGYGFVVQYRWRIFNTAPYSATIHFRCK